MSNITFCNRRQWKSLPTLEVQPSTWQSFEVERKMDKSLLKVPRVHGPNFLIALHYTGTVIASPILTELTAG